MSLETWRSGRLEPDDLAPKDTGLKRYVRVFRERWLLILAAVVISVIGAVAFSLSSDKSYDAEAVLQVTPVGRDDGTFTGISVVREASDPSRDIETLAGTVGTQPVYDEARRLLEKTGGLPSGDISADAVPIANSFLISVTASEGDARDAARVASAFAAAIINVRNTTFNEQVGQTIESLQASLPSAQSDPTARATVQERISALRALQGGPDPSITLLTEAGIPSSPSSPGMRLVVIAGLLVGLFWGSGAALIADSLLSRVRRESQLREGFELPVLARVALAKGQKVGVAALSPRDLDARAQEGYRTLRQNLEMLRRSGDTGRIVVFTSGEPSDGKTTSAINTAAALAESGYRVILMDLDMRRPSIGATLGLTSLNGTADVLAGRVSLDEALVTARGYGNQLMLLLSDAVERPRVELMTKVAIGELLEAAQARADFVIVDTAPLAVVADALPIVAAANDVFISVRRGHTRLAALRRLTDTLAYYDVRVRGFVLIGAELDRGGEENLYYGQIPDRGRQSSAPDPAPAPAREAPAVTKATGKRLRPR
ncbi:MAG TPA: AAA family ATPase [Miltoncostaeaceae bacterium]|nr:AAA family ATPase [Miltoncostaeaceae bacterium]